MNHRTRTAALAAALVITLPLAACGATGPAEPVKNVADSELSGEVTVWSWDVAADALDRLGRDFEDRHPDVDINVVDVGYDNAADKLAVGLKSGTGLPDVVTIETQQTQSYVAKFPGGFRDMTKAATDLESDMDPSKWSAGSRRASCTRCRGTRAPPGCSTAPTTSPKPVSTRPPSTPGTT